MKFFIALTRIAHSSGMTTSANHIRSALGARLHQRGAAYEYWFDPHLVTGSSGYRNAPRPFVLRCLESATELLVFSTDPEREELESAFCSLFEDSVSDRAQLALPLASAAMCNALRIDFLTPTGLKCRGKIVDRPAFPSLIARLCERIRELGMLYQNWPQEAIFAPLLAEAEQVKLIRYDWMRTTGSSRRSARSGVLHDLRGFTGWAEYTGEIGPFLAVLNIGRYTGVGRYTAWGNGQICATPLSDEPAG